MGYLLTYYTDYVEIRKTINMSQLSPTILVSRIKLKSSGLHNKFFLHTESPYLLQIQRLLKKTQLTSMQSFRWWDWDIQDMKGRLASLQKKTNNNAITYAPKKYFLSLHSGVTMQKENSTPRYSGTTKCSLIWY